MMRDRGYNTLVPPPRTRVYFTVPLLALNLSLTVTLLVAAGSLVWGKFFLYIYLMPGDDTAGDACSSGWPLGSKHEASPKWGGVQQKRVKRVFCAIVLVL